MMIPQRKTANSRKAFYLQRKLFSAHSRMLLGPLHSAAEPKRLSGKAATQQKLLILFFYLGHVGRMKQQRIT
jgi:hypothetical protein